MLSLIKTSLQEEPRSQFTLVYANQRPSSIMFRDDLEDLKNQYMDRFQIVHILEHESQDIDLFTGRIDREKCQSLVERLIPLHRIDQAFICGPEPMMLTISDALRAAGLSENQIKYELFTASTMVSNDTRQQQVVASSIESDQGLLITIDGGNRHLTAIDSTESVLQLALKADIDAPFACKAGICSTCRARVLSGDVKMLNNHALDQSEIDQGYVLTCQSFLVSASAHVSYDE